MDIQNRWEAEPEGEGEEGEGGGVEDAPVDVPEMAFEEAVDRRIEAAHARQLQQLKN